MNETRVPDRQAARPAPAVTPEDRLYRIVEDGLCIGFGLCESIAGRGSIRIRTVENGYQRPVVEGPYSLRSKPPWVESGLSV